MFSQRGVMMLAHYGARRAELQAPHPFQPAERRRQRMADAGAGQGLLPAAQHRQGRPLSGDGRRAAAARRRRPPRRGRLGLCARRRGTRRRHHPELPGHRDPPRCRPAGSPASTRHAVSSRRRRSPCPPPATPPSIMDTAGVRLPLESFPVAGAGVGAGQADLPVRRHVQHRPRLHQPVRQGRTGHRLGHRPVRLLQPARRPAADRAYGRGDLRGVPDLHPHADAAQMGRHRRRDAGPLADHRQDAGARASTSIAAGEPAASRRRRARPTSLPTPSPATSRTRSTRPSRWSASPPAG